MNSPLTLTVYAPLDQLPAEGFDFASRNEKPSGPAALLDFYRQALADSHLVFDLSVHGDPNPVGPTAFGRFTLELSPDGDTHVPMLIPTGVSYLIDPGAALPVATDNDALDPEDLVRQFLERLRPILNAGLNGSAGVRRAPLIRWESDPETEGAQVQLLGFLELPEDQFEAFLASDSEFNAIFEEAEVEARGLRETAATLALIGLAALSAPSAEAGLFKKLFSSRDNEPAKAVQVTEAPKPAAARKGWVDVHQDAKIDKKLIESSTGNPTRIIVDVSRQRAFVLIDGKVAIDTPVSTARSGKYTPRGSYRITERVQTGKHSTIYGCEMPYWMRLDESAIGLHIGDLPGYPASAGCVRLPYSVAPVIFSNTRNGTEVKIVDSWDLATNLWQDEDAAKMLIASTDSSVTAPTP